VTRGDKPFPQPRSSHRFEPHALSRSRASHCSHQSTTLLLRYRSPSGSCLSGTAHLQATHGWTNRPIDHCSNGS
jgi:hypothetical protein